MGIEPDMVAGAVHEVLLVGRPVGVLVLHVGLVEQAQAQQLRSHDLAHLFVVLGPERTRHEHFCGLLLYPQHGIVHLPLALGETAAHRDGAGQVARIIGVLGRDIQQEQVTGLALLVVLNVVEHVGIGPRGDDGGVGKAAGAVADKFVQQFGLHLVFPHPGLHKAEQPAKPLFGYAAGRAHELDFFRFLHPAQFGENGKAAGYLMGREPFFGGFYKAGIAGLGDHRLPVVLVGVEINGFGLGHQVEKDLVKLGKPVHRLDARNGQGLLFGELGPFPDRDVVVGFAQEQYLAVLGVQRIGEEQEDGFFLVYPREVKDVALLLEGHGAVGADRVNIVRVEYGQAFGGHAGGKFLAVFDKKAGVDRMVFHRLDAFTSKVGIRGPGTKKGA